MLIICTLAFGRKNILINQLNINENERTLVFVISSTYNKYIYNNLKLQLTFRNNLQTFTNRT